MGCGGAVQIFSQTMSDSLNQLISDEAVYRTAPATPGLLDINKSRSLKHRYGRNYPWDYCGNLQYSTLHVEKEHS